MYDQLSSKNNLFKWKKEGDPTCSLCKTALGIGRHNRVWEELVKFVTSNMKPEPIISTQKFASERVRIYAGSKQTIKHRDLPGQNLLGSSGYWDVFTDLQRWHNNYPKTISSKGLRPDTVILLRVNLKIIVVELCESLMDDSHEYKTSKCEDVEKELEKKGYSIIVKVV